MDAVVLGLLMAALVLGLLGTLVIAGPVAFGYTENGRRLNLMLSALLAASLVLMVPFARQERLSIRGAVVAMLTSRSRPPRAASNVSPP